MDPSPPRRPTLTAALLSLFTVVGLWCVFTGLLVPAVRYESAKEWLATPCTVVDSRVGAREAFGASTPAVEVRYRYTADGAQRESTQYGLGPGAGTGSASAAIVASLPAGTETTCWVDPRRPDQAVLDRSFGDDWWLGVVGLVLAFAGPIAYRALLRRGVR